MFDVALENEVKGDLLLRDLDKVMIPYKTKRGDAALAPIDH
ncbi:hypothetical protein OROMI_002840 [Orobanche minor]